MLPDQRMLTCNFARAECIPHQQAQSVLSPPPLPCSASHQRLQCSPPSTSPAWSPEWETHPRLGDAPRTMPAVPDCTPSCQQAVAPCPPASCSVHSRKGSQALTTTLMCRTRRFWKELSLTVSEQHATSSTRVPCSVAQAAKQCHVAWHKQHQSAMQRGTSSTTVPCCLPQAVPHAHMARVKEHISDMQHVRRSTLLLFNM